MKTAYVCFFWHMHQPYYTDPVSGSASMPWVRLHATKAYFDMAHRLEQFPLVKATFNFTPSLLLQLQEIGEGIVRDLFLEHTEKPAAELRAGEKAFLLKHFFSANWQTMVHPFPRYRELLEKRGADGSVLSLERGARLFTAQDFLDLQVWFNLAWFGYGSVHRYPRLAYFRAKNRGFSEDDKRELLQWQRTVVRDIVPMYRRLLDRGQVELTTTPFYHPILPLVIDTDVTRRARPDLPLPVRFRAPEDAQGQLKQAVEFHTTTFGQPPTGLWPSEGSVCPELISMLPPLGLRWLATDEGNLARSLHADHRPWHKESNLYHAYRVGVSGQEMSMIFRDREISDAFGFIYHKTSPDAAADDVLRRIDRIVRDVPQEHVLIPIVLDGENPWEHYHEGGEQLLGRLYQAFSDRAPDHEGTARIVAATMSEALAAMPPSDRLSHLHSGSWINQDFKIWIGHQEDNRGWDLLGMTRTRLLEVSPTLPAERAKAAWNELYAAEGSDWFWWYGDDFDTAYKEEFDRLFRTHLRNVWTLAGLMPPDVLSEPICGARVFQDIDLVTHPVSFLNPTIDGTVTDFFEWRGAGFINPHPPLGAMWKADGLFTAIYFGWNLDSLFLRLDPDVQSSARRDGLTIELHLQSPGDQYRIAIPMHPSPPQSYVLSRRSPSGSWEDQGTFTYISHHAVLELAIPLGNLKLAQGEEVRMSIVALEQGLELARYPHHQPAVLTVPGPEFEATVWRV
ncbi:glycoside hydrolase family 57 protein [Nitrospira sp. KM1]|uniref:glycoside hydrolase family 57 protein n=1 Tax=Nitrospira sp. KM1 TaxID=1936990 RepID=UPI001E30CE50|nr:glycoside hydrolase family 57 protein [Nitrospira sp. KM1]